MNNKAFNLTILFYFLTLLTFGIIVNIIINLFRAETFESGDLVQSLTLALALSIGMFLGQRARLKPMRRHLETNNSKEPQTFISETQIRVSYESINELSIKLRDANYTLISIDEENNILKICDKIKAVTYGSAASLRLTSDSIIIRSYRLGDNNKKRLATFNTEVIKTIN